MGTPKITHAKWFVSGFDTGHHVGETYGYAKGHADGYDAGHAAGRQEALAEVEAADQAWRAEMAQNVVQRAGEPTYAELQRRRRVDLDRETEAVEAFLAKGQGVTTA